MATWAAWQAPPGARPNRGDAGRSFLWEESLRSVSGSSPGLVARAAATAVPEEWPSRAREPRAPYRTRLTGRLAFSRRDTGRRAGPMSLRRSGHAEVRKSLSSLASSGSNRTGARIEPITEWINCTTSSRDVATLSFHCVSVRS